MALGPFRTIPHLHLATSAGSPSSHPIATRRQHLFTYHDASLNLCNTPSDHINCNQFYTLCISIALIVQ